MLKIRLARYGKTNSPFYRIVVIDSRLKREGRPTEQIGTWNPSTKEVKLDQKKLEFWTKRGAKPTSGVIKLIKE